MYIQLQNNYFLLLKFSFTLENTWSTEIFFSLLTCLCSFCWYRVAYCKTWAPKVSAWPLWCVMRLSHLPAQIPRDKGCFQKGPGSSQVQFIRPAGRRCKQHVVSASKQNFHGADRRADVFWSENTLIWKYLILYNVILSWKNFMTFKKKSKKKNQWVSCFYVSKILVSWAWQVQKY